MASQTDSLQAYVVGGAVRDQLLGRPVNDRDWVVVGATPAQMLEAGFRQVDPRLEEAAATLGAGRWRVFTRITLPLAAPALGAGAALCWARALGEFGATILFAGSFIGRTQTMPLAIYQALETDLGSAMAIAAILILISFAFLVTLRLITHGRIGHPML